MQIQESKTFSYLDQYKILRTLGAGYNAVVKLGQDPQGKQVAIKRYKSETSDIKTLIDELSIMKNLNQENIVRLVAVRQKATYKKSDGSQYDCFAIILEYCAGGQLFDFICDTGKFSQKVTRTYFHQMMSGLHFVHEKGFAHRDIKPENLLLSADFKLKLADFGFATLLKGKDGSGILHTKLGTEGYMAPQILEKKYDGKQIDVFSSGVILFIMLAGCPPFERTTEADPYFKLLKAKQFDKFWKYHQRRRTPGYFPQGFRSLFVNMVAMNPKQRPTIQQIASHPWVKQALCTHSEIKAQFTKRKQILDQMLGVRHQQQQKQKQLHLKEISSQSTSADRSNTEIDSQFLDIYNKQIHIKRNLPIAVTQEMRDFILIKENPVFGISLLKENIKKIYLSLYETSQNLLQSQSQENALVFKSFKDNQKTQIIALFNYKYGTQNLSDQQIQVCISLGTDKNKSLIASFEKKSGNFMYYRKIVAQIKKGFVNKHSK